MVAADGAVLVGSAPARAVTLYESFLAGCFEKAEEVDDSGGAFGMGVTDLFGGWIRARQDAAEIASRLLGWMDDDPYGFCCRLEQDAVTVLDKAGRAALNEQVRSRVERASLAGGRTRTAGGRRSSAGAGRSGIALNARTPSLFAGRELLVLKVRLLGKLGERTRPSSLFGPPAACRQHPSRFTDDDLLKVVPANERDRWHGRALEAAVDADLYSHVELLLQVKETGGSRRSSVRAATMCWLVCGAVRWRKPPTASGGATPRRRHGCGAPRR